MHGPSDADFYPGELGAAKMINNGLNSFVPAGAPMTDNLDLSNRQVEIVVGAYPRIIDLQLRGFAYIRF